MSKKDITPQQLLNILFSILMIVGFFAASFMLVYNFFFVDPPEEENNQNYNQEEEASLPAASIPEDALPELEEALKFEELQDKPFPQAEEGLLALSKEDSAVGYLANRELARGYREEGENPLPHYRLALFLYDDKELRMELAEYLENEGLLDRAKDEYLALLPEDKARKGLLRLEPDVISLSKQLIEMEHWNVALKFLEPLLERDDNSQVKRMYIRSLVGLGEYEEALPLLDNYWTANPTDKEMGFWYARALEITGDADSALLIYSGLGEKGDYRRGIILEQKDRLTEAATALSAAPEPQARWRGAFLWERLGLKEYALPLYKSLAREPGTYQDDAAYRAYILLSKENDPEADEFLQYLAHHPAWMERLGKTADWQLEPELDIEIPHFLHLSELYREWDREELADLEYSIGRNHADTAEKIALGEWYLEKNNYFTAVRLGIQTLREHPSPRAYQLAYPTPYLELVQAAAEEYQLNPYLILAVMREESHYREQVASGAGARGLMQIMPGTGSDIAERLGIEDFETGDLSDPETNIKFGAYYLRSMLNMFDGNLDHALAAYNAGPGHAQRWKDSFLGKEEGGFPTAITFLETREYITKVKNSYLTYLWIYEDEMALNK